MAHEKLTAVRMDIKTVKALERLGKQMDRSVSWLIRKACEEFVERNRQTKLAKS